MYMWHVLCAICCVGRTWQDVVDEGKRETYFANILSDLYFEMDSKRTRRLACQSVQYKGSSWRIYKQAGEFHLPTCHTLPPAPSSPAASPTPL